MWGIRGVRSDGRLLPWASARWLRRAGLAGRGVVIGLAGVVWGSLMLRKASGGVLRGFWRAFLGGVFGLCRFGDLQRWRE